VTPQAFIDLIAPAARQCMVEWAIPASFTIAEAALESAWGASGLADRACNLFGVKADSSWHGGVLVLPTKEYVNHEWITINAKWRKYPDWLACINDHALFFHDNHRYDDCFSCVDGEGWAKRVAAAGYATDPGYSDKLITIMRAHNLAALDAG
jgi:flagellum-specific peptidoglycan hydrolase FlgJ